MSIIEESDTPQDAKPARRGKLVPALLIMLNVGVLALVLVFALGKPELNWFSGDQGTEVDISQLDPAMLQTPGGRRLDVQQFGGYVFEITRLVNTPDARLRSVTITVPGNPPRQAVLRVGDTFASGRIRVADISGAAVVLEHAGEQRTFAVDGADPAEIWARDSGTQVMPATNRGAIPDMPAGQTRPTPDPRIAIEAEREAAAEAAAEEEPEPERVLREGMSLEDLPIEHRVALPRQEFRELALTLHELFEKDFVFGTALNPQTQQPDGARIVNVRPGNVLASRGIRAGDDVLSLNEEGIFKPAQLLELARTVGSAEEISIVIWRESAIAPETEDDPTGAFHLYIFYPGVSE